MNPHSAGLKQDADKHAAWIVAFTDDVIRRVDQLETRNAQLEKANTWYTNRHRNAIDAVNELVRLYDKLVGGRYLADRSILHDLLRKLDELRALQGALKEDVPRTSV